MGNERDNVPTIVQYFNKYFDHIDGSIQAKHKHYAQIKYMRMGEDNGCYMIFDNQELGRIYNSANLIANSMDLIVKFNVDGKEVILNHDTTLEEMKNQFKADSSLILK